jgi:calcineurin-like phosphoesterase family protein
VGGGAEGEEDRVTTFFTSDTHFGHANVVLYCDRPFAVGARGGLERPSEILGAPVATFTREQLRGVKVDVDAMDEELIRRWNARVGPNDTVYHLGDFAMGPSGKIAEYRRRLRGEIRLIPGNHDRSASLMGKAGFTVLPKSWTVRLRDVGDDRAAEYSCALLRHAPSPTFTSKTNVDAMVQLCGHVHERWPWYGNAVNVGVDVRDFEPKTIGELLYDGGPVALQ